MSHVKTHVELRDVRVVRQTPKNPDGTRTDIVLELDAESIPQATAELLDEAADRLHMSPGESEDFITCVDQILTMRYLRGRMRRLKCRA
jgi:hypothetical protein